MTVLLDMAVSLDGRAHASDGGDGGLHDWYFEPSPPSAEVIEELVSACGAMVLGRRLFGTADDEGGWDESEYAVPHLVVTHRPLPAPPPGRQVSFEAVDGVGAAVTRATELAGDRLVVLAGGMDVARQGLALGLVDEIQLHVVDAVFGGGAVLLDDSVCPLALRRTRVVEGVGVTHLRYDVVR